MQKFLASAVLVSAAALSSLITAPAKADEGMWPFNRIPEQAMKKAVGFSPDRAWLEHVRLSSIRFNTGGSGSFVAASGLVLTNHHVGADCIQKLSGPGKDYYAQGFVARQPADEQKCPDLELNVLVSIEDVTAQVQGAAQESMTPAQANAALKAAMTRIEKDCAQQSGQRCDVVTLYAGGLYDLYKYKKYTDVRLVFAPEGQAAFFGGDPDNFTFPRYDYDAALFRAYEDGKPVQPKHFLEWNPQGGQDGEAVFTSGHPGGTSRLLTVAELEVMRDVIYPGRLAELGNLHETLEVYAKRSPEHARQVQSMRHGVDNGLKALGGYLKAVQDRDQLARRQKQEAVLVEAPQAKRAVDDIAKSQAILRYSWARLRVLEQVTLHSKLLGIARGLLRLSHEKTLSDDQRLREFRGSNLASVELALYSPAPIYPELEEALLAAQLGHVQRLLGKDDALWQQVLAGKTPAERARELVAGCKLADVAERKRLSADPAALQASQDPLLALARLLDPEARKVRKQFEDAVEGPVKLSHAALAKAAFAKHGQTQAPDATFTLRLSAGKVAGYQEDGGTAVAPFTTLGGLYARSDKAGDQFPWSLPPKWKAARSKVDPAVPFNVASTNDIIGGNSGSPVVDRRGKLVGLIFDGNLQSLAGQFWFDARQNRAVWVHARGLLEAMRKVYDAGFLADELEGKPRASR